MAECRSRDKLSRYETIRHDGKKKQNWLCDYFSGQQAEQFGESNMRHKDFRPCSVTLRLLPLDSETGLTGVLWLQTNLLK